MSSSLTSQANGTIRYRIPQGNGLKVTFIPEGNYCVERRNTKFAVFLPEANDGSSLGSCIKLEDHRGVELELEKPIPAESKRALLHAATHGTKVTVEVTRVTIEGGQEKLTLKAITIPAE